MVALVILLATASPGILRALLPVWFRLARQELPAGFRLDRTFGVRWMGLYTLGWVLQGLAFWILVRSLGLHLTFFEGVPAYPAAYVAG